MHYRALLFLLLFPALLPAQPLVQWRKALKNTIQSINSAAAIQADKDGNLYVSGTTHENDSAKRMMLVKLDTSGHEQWRRVYKTEEKTDAVAKALAIDFSGNVILTGTVKNKSLNTDIITIKYSSDGIQLWQNIYAGPANLFDAPSAIAVDKKGNVLVCGFETSSEGNPDLLLVRYTASGEMSFVKNIATSKMDVAADVATDDSCNVYVCGSTMVDTRTGDIIVMKYDSTGMVKWYYTYDGANHAVDMATDFTLDDSASVCVTGYANHANDKADIPIIRLNRNGKVICEEVISEGVTDGIGSHLMTSRKSIMLQATFTDYLQQTTLSSVFLADKSCYKKFKFTPANNDVVYFKAVPWQNNTTLFFGSVISRPENTIAPFIEIRDSLRQSTYEYKDEVLISLLRIKDVLLAGRHIYFLGDDTTENAGTISVVKYSFPEEPKKKPKVTNPIKK